MQILQAKGLPCPLTELTPEIPPPHHIPLPQPFSSLSHIPSSLSPSPLTHINQLLGYLLALPLSLFLNNVATQHSHELMVVLWVSTTNCEGVHVVCV